MWDADHDTVDPSWTASGRWIEDRIIPDRRKKVEKNRMSKHRLHENYTLAHIGLRLDNPEGTPHLESLSLYNFGCNVWMSSVRVRVDLTCKRRRKGRTQCALCVMLLGRLTKVQLYHDGPFAPKQIVYLAVEDL